MPTMNKPTLLEKVRAKMSTVKGASLRTLATEVAMSYDTALRIREGTIDPPFSKVQRLAEHFKLVQR